MMEGWNRQGVVDLYQVLGGGTRDGYDIVVRFFTCAFVRCSLMFSVSFFK